MPAATSDSSSPRPHSAPRCVPELDTCWQHVQVTSAQISRGGDGDCARAVIQLGGLTPADVRVELVPAAAGAAGPAGAAGAAAPHERRMFSSFPYDNGCFVFEASLSPHDAAQVDDWLIHVHPREAVGQPPVTHRVRASA